MIDRILGLSDRQHRRLVGALWVGGLILVWVGALGFVLVLIAVGG